MLATPVAADDIYEIDGRLDDAGLTDAYTESIPAENGARIIVDFVSDSTDRTAYEQEAARAAELVWLHLEDQIQTVDVAPTSGVEWLDGDLPPAVSFARAGAAPVPQQPALQPQPIDPGDPWRPPTS